MVKRKGADSIFHAFVRLWFTLKATKLPIWEKMYLSGAIVPKILLGASRAKVKTVVLDFKPGITSIKQLRRQERYTFANTNGKEET